MNISILMDYDGCNVRIVEESGLGDSNPVVVNKMFSTTDDAQKFVCQWLSENHWKC